MRRRAIHGASGEDRLIARYFKPLARHPGALGLIDDAAIFSPPSGHQLVLTADAIVAGMHFFPNDPPDVVARKALRVNLSDLAAKGAKPAGFLLSIALPKATEPGWLRAFVRGLGADAKHYGCPLFGGDTVATAGPIAISVTAFGTLPRGTMVQRAGARVGDRIVVTGTIGDAALGLRLRKEAGSARRWKLDAAMQRHLADRYLLPLPRNALSESVRRYATAGLDVSDGLAGDLNKLCRASGVGAEIDVARIPLSKAAKAALEAEPRLIETIVTGGDDFEIVAAVPSKALAAFKTAARRVRVPLTEIGRVTAGEEALFCAANGRQLTFDRASFSHF